MLISGHEFPDELWYSVEHQVWARVEGAEGDEGRDGGVATVGITALGIALAGGEIYMARPKSVGSVVEQDKSIAVVELAKSIVAVKSPVHGLVVAANEALAAHPELVHLDPYGAGWLARLKLADFAADRLRLVHGEAAREPLAHHAWLHRAQLE
jgi:glycine cleavage system H protein